METSKWLKVETTENKELFEAMEAIRMVLDVANEEGLSDKEICDAIDWSLLQELNKKYPQRERTYTILPLTDKF
jgi:hypothetical protein|tara:strand:- start:180 stop:401 length:222 start_codon:yes stop_codon:yes gene_type:complete